MLNCGKSMRKTFLFILCVVSSLSLSAQSGVLLPADKAGEVMRKLTSAASEIKSLQCSFIQTKTSTLLAEAAVSKGKMAFSSPDRLRWEYTEPFSNVLIVRGDSVYMSGHQARAGSAAERIQKAITGMVTGMVSGRKLFDESQYEIQLFDDGRRWRAEMLPKSRSMKRMFTRLTLCFDKQSQRVVEVKFVEVCGDQTTIQFKEVVCNAPVDQSLFSHH